MNVLKLSKILKKLIKEGKKKYPVRILDEDELGPYRYDLKHCEVAHSADGKEIHLW
ncbi:MAG: hypothetical protein ACREBU_04385 [Nitrososphaera sp.]